MLTAKEKIAKTLDQKKLLKRALISDIENFIGDRGTYMPAAYTSCMWRGLLRQDKQIIREVMQEIKNHGYKVRISFWHKDLIISIPKVTNETVS